MFKVNNRKPERHQLDLLPKILICLIDRRKIGKISLHKQLWTVGPRLRNWCLKFTIKHASLNETVVFPWVKAKRYKRLFHKSIFNIFMVTWMKNVFPVNIVVDKNILYICESMFKINRNFNQASHLNKFIQNWKGMPVDSQSRLLILKKH